MANLKRKSTKKIIVSNIKKKHSDKWEIIDAFLPNKYAKEVNKTLPEAQKFPDNDLSYIRHVKTKKINNDLIINALYIVAKARKAQIENMNFN